MVRAAIGKIIEWALGYERIVYFTGYRSNDNMNGNVPWAKHNDDAGYDLFVEKYTVIPSQSVAEIPTGIRISTKSRIWFEIKARSSTFKRLGMEVQDAIIDRGYRGEMFAIVYNPTDNEVRIQKDTRICQIVPHLLLPCRFVPADALLPSKRGEAGFGSTGV